MRSNAREDKSFDSREVCAGCTFIVSANYLCHHIGGFIGPVWKLTSLN